MQRKLPKLIDGVECWLCPSCMLWVPRNGYYGDKRRWNGIKTQCKKCHTEGNIRTRDKENTRRLRRESMARRRSIDAEKHMERDRENSRKRVWTEKMEARYQLNLAIRRGEIVRPDKCIRCGSERKLHAHHPDYSRPLFVEWLCTICHGKEHRNGD
jgi:NAD-dependent dihydropyrimidine dehydrogenase PreA subunit